MFLLVLCVLLTQAESGETLIFFITLCLIDACGIRRNTDCIITLCLIDARKSRRISDFISVFSPPEKAIQRIRKD